MAVKKTSRRQGRTGSNRLGYTSSVPGVYFRDDGSTRWIVKFRDEKGKMYRPQMQWPVDLRVSEISHPLHVRKAQADAEAEATRERSSRLTHGKSHTEHGEAWTLGQMLEKALKECEDGAIKIKSARTLESNLRVLLGKATVGHNKNGFPRLTGMKVNKLSFEDFYNEDDPQAFNHLLKGRGGQPATNGSVVKMLKSIQFVFKRAQKTWKINFKNPLPTLNIEVGDARERVLTSVEWDEINKELVHAGQATRDAIHVARYTATRRAEVIKLDWPDINWDKKVALLRGTKSKRGAYRQRVIPLHGEAFTILERRYQETKDKLGPVFAHEHGGKWRRMAIDTTTQAWTRARSRAAIRLNDPSILTARAHDLRHTRITEMGSMPNITIAEAAAVTGHSDLRQFMRYFNPDPELIGEKFLEYEASAKARSKEGGAFKASIDEAVEVLVALGAKDSVYIALGKAMEKLDQLPVPTKAEG